jgi:heptosyltransferase-2
MRPDGRSLPSRILVAQTIFLGDLILTFPLVTALRLTYPAATIDFLVQKDLADVAAVHPDAHRILSMDKRGKHRGIRGIFRLIRELRASQYDLAIILPGSIRTAIAVWMAGIPRRIGWDPGSELSGQMKQVRFPGAMKTLPHVRSILLFETLYRWSRPFRKMLPSLFTDTLKLDPGVHQARRWIDVLSALNVPTAASVRIPWLPISESIKANVVSRFPSGEKGSVVLAPGASQLTRRWPEENFTALTRTIAADGFTVYVSGGPSDAESCARIVRSAGSPSVISVTGILTTVEAMALIQQSVCVVANDSAPVHMASAVGTPAVALFGPTLPSFGFAPLAQGSIVLERTGLSCRPCTVYGSPACPMGTHDCLRSISVEEVRDAVLAIARSRRGES